MGGRLDAERRVDEESDSCDQRTLRSRRGPAIVIGDVITDASAVCSILGAMSLGHGREVRAGLIEDAASLRPLEDRWRDLAEARGNVFVTPEWFFTWLRHHADRARPLVPTAWAEDGTFVGLLPMVQELSGRPRRIRFAGASLGDWFHPVASLSDQDAVASAAGRALGLGAGDRNVLVLDNVDEGQGWAARVAASSDRSIHMRHLKRSVLPYVEISQASWEAYFAGQSANFRRDLRRKLARLERAHEVRFRRTLTADELEDDLHTLYRLHDLRWAERGGSAAASSTTREFISDLARVTHERGWLRLWMLELDGEPVVSLLQWLIGPRLLSYYTGFDPSLTRESVGLVLTGHTLRSAIEEGAREFNMLLGGDSWKSRFGNSERPVETTVLVRAAHPARLVVSAESGMRRAVDRLPPGVKRRVQTGARPIRALLPTARR